MQPFLVEIDPLRQHFANRLVQTCREQPADTSVCHDAGVTDSNLAAAILAGGQARRFGGRDKSRLVIDGRTIIVRQLEVLQRLTSDVFIVASDAARFADLGCAVVPDVVPASGAIGGLLTALERARAGRVLVVACDLPYLDGPTLERLAELAGEGDGGWLRSPRGVEPLLACYARAVRFAIRGEILAGRLKLGGLDAVLRMRALDVPDADAASPVARMLTNVNTPAEYERIQ
jgi:molybdopterin-guanine dinucleotide biosynthesis protein A